MKKNSDELDAALAPIHGSSAFMEFINLTLLIGTTALRDKGSWQYYQVEFYPKFLG